MASKGPENTLLSTGKEKDSETGYYYFGARYYNPDLSLWLSVDPMSDKYPSLSPYNYCAWNPMKIVDPDGEDIYRLDISTGSLKLYQKTKDKTDQIIAGSYSGIGRARTFKETRSLTFSKGILDGQKGKDYSKTGFTSTGGKQEAAIDVAKFISFNSNIELSGAGYTDGNKAEAQIFGWSNNTYNQSDNPGKYSAPDNSKEIFHFHTHPGKADGTMGHGIPGKADLAHAKKMSSSYGENNFYIISRKDGVTQYNQIGVIPSGIHESYIPKSLRKHIKR